LSERKWSLAGPRIAIVEDDANLPWNGGLSPVSACERLRNKRLPEITGPFGPGSRNVPARAWRYEGHMRIKEAKR